MTLYFDENLPPQLAKALNLLQINDPDYNATVSSIAERFYRGIPD
jgi:predicted nuclease of predicted toxin-antitoxin system